MSEKSEFYEQMMTAPLSRGNDKRKGRSNEGRRSQYKAIRSRKDPTKEWRLIWMEKAIENGTISPPLYGPI